MKHADDIDPEVLQGAAHELGHAVVDLAGGVSIDRITLNTRTGLGLTTVTAWPDEGDTEMWAAWLVGVVAGFEAERLWCARHGGHASRGNSGTDFGNFRRYRRRAGLSEGAARSRASSVLRSRWSRIERLAPELAEHGRISPSAVGGRKGWW